MLTNTLNLLFNLPMVEIKLYNIVHILVVLFFPAMAIATYFIFRKRSEKAKLIYIWIIMGIAFFATWITFITALITDDNNQRINFFARLPLHMCSINVILYPLFFGLRNKMNKFFRSTTFAYMYFMGSLGAVLAMVVTAPSDCAGVGINLLRYNVFTYWLKHGLIFIIPFLFVALGYYRPKILDIFKAILFLLCLLTIMEIVNLVFTQLNYLIGGTEIANFFYTSTGKGTAVLEILWNLFPVELLYLLPLGLVAIPLFALYYLPYGVVDIVNLIKRKRNLKKQNQ